MQYDDTQYSHPFSTGTFQLARRGPTLIWLLVAWQPGRHVINSHCQQHPTRVNLPEKLDTASILDSGERI